MVRKIKQIRFPEQSGSIVFTDGWSNNLVQDLGNVVQLGIYALPGTQFRINQDVNINSLLNKELIINNSGLFSVNIEDNPIISIQLSENSYENIKEAHAIIIDLVYVERGVE